MFLSENAKKIVECVTRNEFECLAFKVDDKAGSDQVLGLEADMQKNY